MSEQPGIWQILEQLSLRPTEETERVIRLAWQGEQHRTQHLDDEPESLLSRTTLLWAATCVDEGLIGLLEEAKLDYKRWLDRNGLLDAPRELQDEPPEPLPFNDDVREAIEQAAELAPERLDVPALLVGVFSAPRGLFPKVFRDCRGRPDEARDLLMKARAPRADEPPPVEAADVEQSKAQVAQRQAPQAVDRAQKKAPARQTPAKPTPTKSNAVPLAVNDVAGARTDLLDAKEYADLFARLAAARDLKPPLAFGLFGAWGAGKSYFMDLMEAQVRELEAGKVDGIPASESWRAICQIRFNAWHYMDADLWASLAGTIFESIALQLGKETDRAKVAKRRADLKKRLRSTIEAEREATRRENEAAAALGKAHTDLVKAERAFEDKRLALEAQVDALVWSKLRGDATSVAFEASLKALGIHPESDGVKRLLTSTTEARRVADDARSVAGQARGLAMDIRRNPSPWIFGIAVLYLLPLGLQLLSQVHDKLAPLREGMTAGLTQIATLVGLFAHRIKTVTGHVEEVLTFAQRVEAEGAKLRQEALEELLASEDDETKAIAEEHDEAAKKLEVARAKVSGLRGDIRQIREELSALEAGKLVYDFVLERSATDGIYRSREGIVSIVRRDLETLGDLLLQWNKQPPAETDEAADGASNKEPPLPEPKSLDQRTLDEMPLQRIVLYIDDLDRCPPERVTEVLQAVHLLLAFDLFVVVVAVDPRWLERSLETSYDKLLGKRGDLALLNGSRHDGFHHRAASARDYLEKIFQVPFTIPRVDDVGFEKLIGEHLESHRGRAERLEREAKDEKRRAEEEAARKPRAKTKTKKKKRKTKKVPAKVTEGSATSSQPDATNADATNADATRPTTDTPTTVATSFVIEDDEQPFAHRLWALFRTPRSIKRFANIYRLLRAKVPEADYPAFVAPNPNAGHRAVFTLVAANTVCPRVTSALLRALAWPNTLGLDEEDLPTTWPEVVDALGKPDGPLRRGLALDAEQRAELKRLLPVLKLVEREVPEDLAIWQHWAPRVGRFSLYWHAD